MEAAPRGRRPGQKQARGRVSAGLRPERGNPSATGGPVPVRREEPRAPERRRQRASPLCRESIPSRGASEPSTRSPVSRACRQRRERDPRGSHSRAQRHPGQWPEDSKPRAWRHRLERGSLAALEPRRGCVQPTQQRRRRRTLSRSCERSSSGGRRPESPRARPASPKRPCHQPAAAGPPERLPGRLLGQVGAMQVLLEELQAPGGAFLPPREPLSPDTQPSAQQRAWLSWHLAQAGATLHRAFALVDSLLASQP